MTTDPYAAAGPGWAAGAELVYGPIAEALVDTFPHPVAGRVVLDAGAGTGAVGRALSARGAQPVAVDLSYGMLAWNAATRPPSVVADIRALPLAVAAVDDAVAAFVLNHLADPTAGLAELRRVTRPRGAVLATSFSNASRHEARDRLDTMAVEAGLRVPDWYREIKSAATAAFGTMDAAAAAARSVGLTHVEVAERPVDVGVTTSAQLVRYRLAQPLYAGWLRELGPARAAAFAREAATAIAPLMYPYRPRVVFLSALVG